MGSRLQNPPSAIWPLTTALPDAGVRSGQPWLHSPGFDGLLIIGPGLFSAIAVMLFAPVLSSIETMPLWAWAVLIMGVDVAHVYSTLFRTYFDRDAFARHKTLLTITPLLCWMAGCLLYSFGALTFWRVLAYVALFHFIRQQYGFLKIYMRADRDRISPFWQKFDSAVLYLSMIYPVIYWHCHLPREFSWFVEGDFIALPVLLSTLTGWVYIAALGVYCLKEILQAYRHRTVNIPKNLLILGTAAAWYTGIVLFNGDMIFTLTNVLAHGIPYVALIWLYGRKVETTAPSRPSQFLFSLAGLPFLILLLWLFAFMEEGLWDGLVWRDHTVLFTWFAHLPQIVDKHTLAWLIPLLAVPQFAHYVLDGFIWRLKPGEDTRWTQALHQ